MIFGRNKLVSAMVFFWISIITLASIYMLYGAISNIQVLLYLIPVSPGSIWMVVVSVGWLCILAWYLPKMILKVETLGASVVFYSLDGKRLEISAITALTKEGNGFRISFAGGSRFIDSFNFEKYGELVAEIERISGMKMA
jgi:hypothetical protein